MATALDEMPPLAQTAAHAGDTISLMHLLGQPAEMLENDRSRWTFGMLASGGHGEGAAGRDSAARA